MAKIGAPLTGLFLVVSGAGGGWDLSIEAEGVATREDHAAAALRGFTVKGLTVPCEVAGGTEAEGTGAV